MKLDRDARIAADPAPNTANAARCSRRRMAARRGAAMACRPGAGRLRLSLVAAIGLEGPVGRLRSQVWRRALVLGAAGDQYPTVMAYRDFLVNVMIPHWTFFGWMTLITETFIAVTLILGLFTRLGSLAAIGMAANITIGILGVPHEWGWTYVMLIMLPSSSC